MNDVNEWEARKARRRAMIKSPDAAYVEGIDNVVHLSDAQKTIMFGIFDARDRDVKAWEAQNAAKMQAARKALSEAWKGGDKETFRRANEDYFRVRGPLYEIVRQFDADLDNVLTPDQKAKLQNWMAIQRIKGITEPIQLSDEQVKQVLAAVGGVRNKLNYGVVEKVLTPDQKRAIAKYRAMLAVKGMFQGDPTLTAQQWKQVEARCDVLVKDVKNPFDTGEIVSKLRDMADALLTPEQREANEAKAESGNPHQPQTGGGLGGMGTAKPAR
jgi:Spy/CpxP family protein refolding chaperone